MEHGPGETSEEDRDCSDFDTQPEAQRFFEVNRSDSSQGDSWGDPYGLDGDGGRRGVRVASPNRQVLSDSF